MLVELRYGIEDRQARAGGTFAVVIVGLGVAEEGHNPIAKVLRDMPAKALDGLRRRVMVLGDDLPPSSGSRWLAISQLLKCYTETGEA